MNVGGAFSAEDFAIAAPGGVREGAAQAVALEPFHFEDDHPVETFPVRVGFVERGEVAAQLATSSTPIPRLAAATKRGTPPTCLSTSRLKGRNETGPHHNLKDWVRHHDRYGVDGFVNTQGRYVSSEPTDSPCGCGTNQA